METDLKRDAKQKIAGFIVDSGLYFGLAWSFLYKFRTFDIQEKELLWPVFWVTEGSVESIVAVCRGILYLAPFLTLVKKTRWLGQGLTFICAVLVIAISYSNGKSYHSGLVWIIFMLSYFGVRWFVRPHHAIHFAFFCFSTAYINSGLWKLRSLADYLWETGDFSVLVYTLQEHISASAVERVQEPTWLGQLVLENLWLSGVLWVGALIVEVGACAIPLFRRQAWMFALALACFHLGVLLTMQINFMSSMVLLSLLTVYFLVKKEDLKTAG